jgi:hypothetical protein
MRTVAWSSVTRHRRWLATQAFEQTTRQIVFQDYVEVAVWAAQDRRDQLEARIFTRGKQRGLCLPEHLAMASLKHFGIHGCYLR